jgi:hypothetical protein
VPDRYQVMIDIETLGKKPGCVVLSVGAVVMDMEKLKTVARSYWVLDTKEQEHFKIDADTVLWWMQQSDDARAAFRKIIPPTNAANFKTELQALFDQYKTKTVWANGINFDLPILGQYMHNLDPFSSSVEEVVPWNYRWQDMRSLATVMARVKPYDQFYKAHGSVAHNALDDAVRQAEYVLECIKWINDHA